VEIEQLTRLRLVVAVPEADVGAIVSGAKVTFTVPAHPGRSFSGTIARVSRSLDPKSRTMPVEVEVANAGALLAPGMYADVTWPVRRVQPSLWVPPTAIVTTTERTFVIRARDGKAEWVNVTRGAKQGDLLEIRGPISAGDKVVKRASDEIREGTRVP
jgi:RND family efflux transporter MFP subunit